MQNSPKLQILQINTFDKAGGAERVAWNLFNTYRQIGYPSWLIVGRKKTTDPDVFEISNHKYSNILKRNLMKVARQFEKKQEDVRGMYRLKLLTEIIADPYRWKKNQLGYENFDFPGTYDLLNMIPLRPQIVHCHNLHGGYFDLRALPWLSHQVPVLITLHDAWMLSGHCAHSFNCDRWKIGCGECPDLTIPPAIPRDGTKFNWERKREIYSQSQLLITTPSQWLMDKVKQSTLSNMEHRVIPNGVDLEIFKPGDKLLARKTLGLPLDYFIILFASNKIRYNPWRDFATLKEAVQIFANKVHRRKVIFICLGDQGESRQINIGSEIRFIPFQKDIAQLVFYYQAADVYLYAAKADTFPNTIIEASACGTPVIATAVGGIPEQIDNEVTGFLVSPFDAEAMANRIEILYNDIKLSVRISNQAVQNVFNKFNLKSQVNAYLDIYNEISQVP